MLTEELRIKKAHIALMKHPETALYSGVMLMGKSEVVDSGCPTAYTDGVNKVYGRAFLERILTEPKVRGLILHENLHVALKQVAFGSGMFKEHRKMANLAADFVVNDMIKEISDAQIELPDGALWHPMFHKFVNRIESQEVQAVWFVMLLRSPKARMARVNPEISKWALDNHYLL